MKCQNSRATNSRPVNANFKEVIGPNTCNQYLGYSQHLAQQLSGVNRGVSSSQIKFPNVKIMARNIFIATIMDNGTNGHLIMVEKFYL